MRVDYERVMFLLDERRKINHAPLEDIEIYYKDELLVITEAERDHWKLTGLNNVDFVELFVGELVDDPAAVRMRRKKDETGGN